MAFVRLLAALAALALALPAAAQEAPTAGGVLRVDINAVLYANNGQARITDKLEEKEVAELRSELSTFSAAASRPQGTVQPMSSHAFSKCGRTTGY